MSPQMAIFPTAGDSVKNFFTQKNTITPPKSSFGSAPDWEYELLAKLGISCSIFKSPFKNTALLKVLDSAELYLNANGYKACPHFIHILGKTPNFF